ncbi:hypothetical protein JJB11_17825 [Ramlibacter ginsenosidimutans]|uniref:Uncharacterized protein n=1 Tax=Ramlibacter ginsenosidimutans TaxID=502333 RepID=A0A934TUR9_9BURK|nr:hypothetical protein [Ramlibacter ginsenosidimutans]MBK6007962.1 hypothetical protein [Ramlibacter ginsenosidimutans]
MHELELDVADDACTLRLDGRVLARLDGGAEALLSGAGERLRELDIEVAIERSEEWLMPSSRLLQGLELKVRDATGRMRSMLGASASFTLAEVEQAFARAHDAVAHGRPVSRGGVADVVLLRELAHHGRLSRILLA